MAKRKQFEVAFGSDAFLDVIANMVGILIILIVIAGLRVSRAPVRAVNASPAEPVDAEAAVEEPLAIPTSPTPFAFAPQLPPEFSPEELENLFGDKPVPVPPTIAVAAPLELPHLPALATPQAPQELVSEATQLEASLVGLRQQLEASSTESQQHQDHAARIVKSLEQLKSQAADAVSALHNQRVHLQAVEDQLKSRESAVAQFQVAIDARKEAAPPVENLEHRLTPIGQSVDGEELHFRLEGNRVSHVPVLDLAGLVKQDIERRREIIFNRSFYKGQVGPRDGYRLEYLVQREGDTLAGEMRYGVGVIRIEVSSWVIVPDRTLESESLEEATQPESRFIRALRKAKGNTTITLWVYPDSFELHRKLKELIHNTGFAVASRPLPAGIPIAGSPDGSKSISQ